VALSNVIKFGTQGLRELFNQTNEIIPIGKFQMPAGSCRQLFKNVQVFINRFNYSRPANLYNDLSTVR
jgi:hypothetical protein